MILDKYNEFSDGQDVNDASTTEYGTSVIDLGSAGDAEARPIRLHIQVLTAFVGVGTTATFSLETSVDEAFSSPIQLWTTAALAKAALVAGYKVTGPSGVRLPSGGKQYLRVKYVADDLYGTSANVDAFLSFDGDSNEF